MASRGPNGQRLWLGDGVGLVHRRLSIIDLSDMAACPLFSEDGTLTLVFNGEIYNFRELRKDLITRGHQFRSSGDSEVVLHGFEEWGHKVLERLDGMFAIALWDARREELFLARDRLGEKPLYFARFNGRFYFGSNPMVIVEGLGRVPEIDLQAVDCFLSHTFIPSNHTIFKAVHTLPAATYMIVRRSGELQHSCYWRLPDERFDRLTVPEAVEMVETALIHSVEGRLVADVPVGGLLSGGVDSSLVMAIAARQIPSLRTFTIGFAEANYDERPFAAVVAQHIGAQHVDCTMSVADVLECLPRLVWEYGQPFGDNSAVATYLVHQLAKEDVTVVLTGDGGDEAFGGYWRALAARYAELYRRCIPAVIRRNVLPNAMSLLDRVGCETLAARWRRLEQQTNDSCGSPYTNALSWYELRPHALGSALKPIASNHVPADCFRRQQDQGEAIPLMESAMRADYATQLADCFLVKTDVAGMAAAVETRAPMLAHEIVELAWRLPDSLKVRVLGGTKWLLKRITAGYVPSKVVFRRKQGFSLPLDVWFRGKLGDVLSTLIIDSRLARWNLLDTAAMKRVLMEHISGRKNHEIRLWLMLWLELWFRICIETEIDPTESLA